MASKSARFLDASQGLINYAVVPKHRKEPKFELIFKILDLNNVPLVTGTSFVRWHLPHSAAAEHRGKTHKAPIKEHKVTWDYEKTTQLRVTADKNGLLQTTDIHFEIIQEYNSGSKAERIALGIVRLNLAEYVSRRYDGEEEITRRYLMQESKINSTVKISISMRQIEGERDFEAPPLRAGPIFGGIAGIMNHEQVEPDDIGHLPTLSTNSLRDVGEQQDIYRKTLAAAWSSQELPADECIEDIFAGGDGWGKIEEGSVITSESLTNDEHDGSDVEHLRVPGKNKRAQDRPNGPAKSRDRMDHHDRGNKTRSDGNEYGRATENATPASSSSGGPSKHIRRRQNEVSEIDVREDLRSWQIRARAGDNYS